LRDRARGRRRRDPRDRAPLHLGRRHGAGGWQRGLPRRPGPIRGQYPRAARGMTLMAGAGGSVIDRLPGRHVAAALLVAASRRMGREWVGTPAHRWLLAQGRPDGLAAMPRDPRPASVAVGRQILAGAFVLAGETLA